MEEGAEETMKKHKGIWILLLAAVMVCALTAVALAAERETFEDVRADAWYAPAVEYCREQGLMGGVSADRFSPDGAMTRAMLATVLHRQAGEPTVPGQDDFTDTEDGQWYSQAVLWASRQGIMEGYGDGRFGSEEPVTREQLVTILWRLAGSPQASAEPFGDQEQIASYAVTAVAWAREHGVVSGRGDNRFAPREVATRAEVAAVLANAQKNQPNSTPAETPSDPPENSSAPVPTAVPETASHILVAYFSATHNTENIANHIKTALGEEADLYQITPAVPYTSADLNYNTDCRANREQNDPSARPELSGTVPQLEQYDVVFLGYPIWWGRAPKILYTFLESHDMTGKTVIPFCTSGSSPYHDGGIRELVGSDTTWLTGQRFSGGASASSVAEWVASLELPEQGKEENSVYLQIGDALWTATLEDNPSAEAFRELLAQGSLTVDMSDYGGFEKVGPIGSSLPQTNRQITTRPGDIVLYQGSSITIYYGVNSWNFTLLGHVDGVSEAQLREALKAGGENVSVTFSLTGPTA